MSELTDCLLTFDVDWAPDFVIESAAAMLRERELRSTWFVTHEAPALALLRRSRSSPTSGRSSPRPSHSARTPSCSPVRCCR